MKIDLRLLQISTAGIIALAESRKPKDVPLLDELRKHKNTIDAMLEQEPKKKSNSRISKERARLFPNNEIEVL